MSGAYGYASLYLGNQSIAVTGYGSGPEEVFLGSGAVTFQGGSGSNYVFSHAPPTIGTPRMRLMVAPSI